MKYFEEYIETNQTFMLGMQLTNGCTSYFHEKIQQQTIIGKKNFNELETVPL